MFFYYLKKTEKVEKLSSYWKEDELLMFIED